MDPKKLELTHKEGEEDVADYPCTSGRHVRRLLGGIAVSRCTLLPTALNHGRHVDTRNPSPSKGSARRSGLKAE